VEKDVGLEGSVFIGGGAPWQDKGETAIGHWNKKASVWLGILGIGGKIVRERQLRGGGDGKAVFAGKGKPAPKSDC